MFSKLKTTVRFNREESSKNLVKLYRPSNDHELLPVRHRKKYLHTSLVTLTYLIIFS